MALVNNVNVYGLEESVAASGYSFALFPSSSLIPTERDWTRAARLAGTNKGEGHDQFLTSIVVQFDLTLSIKAWVEAERYKFLDFCTSMSTMHKICSLDINECCNEWVDDDVKGILQKKIAEYNENPNTDNFLRIVYNIPTGFEYTARMSTNYRQLKTIYSQRKNHRLPEWKMFCEWIETLPHAKEFIIGEKNNETRN